MRTSAIARRFQYEEGSEKLRWATKWGALITVIGSFHRPKNIHETREWIIPQFAVPIGTVPSIRPWNKVGGKAEENSPGTLPRYLDRNKANREFDYFTVHAGVLLATCRLTAKRMPGIVSRGVPSWLNGAWRPPQGEVSLHALSRNCEVMRAYRCELASAMASVPAHRRCNDEASIRRVAHPGVS